MMMTAAETKFLLLYDVANKIATHGCILTCGMESVFNGKYITRTFQVGQTPASQATILTKLK
jgi:hypothetical protein